MSPATFQFYSAFLHWVAQECDRCNDFRGKFTRAPHGSRADTTLLVPVDIFYIYRYSVEQILWGIAKFGRQFDWHGYPFTKDQIDQLASPIPPKHCSGRGRARQAQVLGVHGRLLIIGVNRDWSIWAREAVHPPRLSPQHELHPTSALPPGPPHKWAAGHVGDNPGRLQDDRRSRVPD